MPLPDDMPYTMSVHYTRFSHPPLDAPHPRSGNELSLPMPRFNWLPTDWKESLTVSPKLCIKKCDLGRAARYPAKYLRSCTHKPFSTAYASILCVALTNLSGVRCSAAVLEGSSEAIELYAYLTSVEFNL